MKPLFEGHTLLFLRHKKGAIFSVLLLIDHSEFDSKRFQWYCCVIINSRYVQFRLNCLLARVSTHAGSAWQVHYFDCRLTICLYDRRPRSFAIDRRKHIDLSPCDLQQLSNLTLHTDGHVECFPTESGIDCVKVNGRVIFFCVRLNQPSCHLFLPAICSHDSLALPHKHLFCLF